jgi:hypothetical protein
MRDRLQNEKEGGEGPCPWTENLTAWSGFFARPEGPADSPLVDSLGPRDRVGGGGTAESVEKVIN